MITCTATGPGGKKLIILGITYGNVLRLKDDQPIDVSAETHPGFPEDLNIVIFYKDTESQLTEALGDLIGEDTKIVIVPHDKPSVT